MTPAPRVLYITGMTRCGSTLLGNVLNEVPGVEHVGELHYLWRNAGLRAGTNSRCGCGRDITGCSVWSAVLARAGEPCDAPAARRMVDAQHRHLRTRHTPVRLAEVRGGLRAPPAVAAATAATIGLYRAVAAVLDAQVVVDSSKYPAEAAALCGRDDIDLRVVHLVRDPRATALSYRRDKDYIARMAPPRVMAHWAGINAASDLLGAALDGRYLRLRHEDVTRRPRQAVAEILRFAGVAGPNPVDDAGRVALGDNHTVTGNPDRLARGTVAFRPDERWRSELSWAPRALATVAAGPQLLRYRYPTR